MTQEDTMSRSPDTTPSHHIEGSTRVDGRVRRILERIVELSKTHPNLARITVTLLASFGFASTVQAQDGRVPDGPDRQGRQVQVVNLNDAMFNAPDGLHFVATDESDGNGRFDDEAELRREARRLGEALIDGGSGDGGDGDGDEPEPVEVEPTPVPRVTARTVNDGDNSNVRTSPLTGEANRHTRNGSIDGGEMVVFLSDPAELARLADIEGSNIELRDNGQYYMVDPVSGGEWPVLTDRRYFYIRAANGEWYVLDPSSFSPEDPNVATIISEIRIVDGSITEGTEPTPDVPPTPNTGGTLPPGTQAPIRPSATELPVTPVPNPQPGGDGEPPTDVPDDQGFTDGEDEPPLVPTENPSAIMSGELGQLVTPTLVTDSAIFYMPENMYGAAGQRIRSIEFDFTPEETEAGTTRWLAEIYHNLLVNNELDENGVSYTVVMDLPATATIEQITNWIDENRGSLPRIPYRYRISRTGNDANDFSTGFADPNQPIEFYPIPASMRPAATSTNPTATPQWMELTRYGSGISGGRGVTVDSQTGAISIYFGAGINDGTNWTAMLGSSMLYGLPHFSHEGEPPGFVVGMDPLFPQLAEAWGMMDESGNLVERAAIVMN